MADINKVILIGGLVQEPKALGKALKLRVATSRKYTKDGETKEFTQYHDVILREKTAEVIGKYIRVGEKVYIEGELEYVEKDGKFFTNIRAMDIQLLSPKGDKVVDKAPARVTQSLPEGEFDDEIPF